MNEQTIKTLEAAVELCDKLSGQLTKADSDWEQNNDHDAFDELVGWSYDGMLASYHGQFSEALAALQQSHDVRERVARTIVAQARIWAKDDLGNVVQGFIENPKPLADAILATLSATPVSKPRDTQPEEIGEVGNLYGGVHVKRENGKPYWVVAEECGAWDWEEISEPLYDALRAHGGHDA